MSITDVFTFLQHGSTGANPSQSAWQAMIFTLSVLAASLMLALIICLVYQRTHRGVQYSRSFVLSLALLPCVVSVLFMVIGGSVARAFGTVGALSLIRFRSVVKDTVDLAYIFIAITVGLCVGSGNFVIGATATLGLMGIVVLFNQSNFGSAYSQGYILRFIAQQRNGDPPCYSTVLAKYRDKLVLLNTHNMHDQVELVYTIKRISEADREGLVHELMAASGVDSVGLVSSTGEVEY